MIYEGDIEKAKQLLRPARTVIKKGVSIRFDPFEKRIQLWNQIRENQDIYENENCGKILEDLDTHYRATFDFSLLILSKVFELNDEDFKAATMFTDQEKKIIDKIDQYSVFEISSKHDIKKKVISKDKKVMNLFEDYFLNMEQWVDKTINNPEVRLTLRYYVKKKWREYKEKINDAVNDLIKELDWFGVFISQLKEGTDEKDIDTIEASEKTKEKIYEIEKENGPRFIEIGEAKFYENNFIGRIKNKIHRNLEFSGKKFKVDYLQEHSSITISQYHNGDLGNIPENRYIVSLIKRKGLFKKESIFIKAIYFTRVEKLKRIGLDTFPLELVDINPFITEAINDAKNEKMLLCIGSPTGFSKEVYDHICGEEFHKNFLSSVSICLVDLVKGSMIINPHDSFAKQFKDLFDLEIDEEKVANIKNKIIIEMMEKGGVSLGDLMKKTNTKKPIIEKAFYDLKEERGYISEYQKDIGSLVLMKG